MDHTRLGERLRMAREYARMTQVEAAQALGVSPAALNQYESGKRRIEAMTLDTLSRLYGVPVTYFYGEEPPRPDWEEALRLKAEEVSSEGKAGIARLTRDVYALEELYAIAGIRLPGVPHPPFAPLPENNFGNEEVDELADKTRRHYDLGLAPLTDLRAFLEAEGFKMFAVPFGSGDEGHLSGLSFNHVGLGPLIAVNQDQAYSRRPFTLAHEFAHRLFHYDRPAILSRAEDARPLEVFADRFAAYFLVPSEALHERLRDQEVKIVRQPEDVVHLARYFSISYRAMLHRLREEGRVADEVVAAEVKPVLLAQLLGYSVSPFELGRKLLPPEERLPRVFVELTYRAVGEGRLSLRRGAELLGISDLELEERLNPEESGEME